MRRALSLAERGRGWVSPNPAVGAVILDRGGRVIGEGWHARAGAPHAEVAALAAVGDRRKLAGATLVVTLEPCSTHGRTPPCVEAIIEAGIARVVAGCIDPNPAHAGAGLARLRQAGVKTECGLLESECQAVNRGFFKWIRTGRPWVVAKMALSLDGRLTRPPGEPRQLTSQAALSDVQEVRSLADAIMVGAGTVRADDPRLTLRLPRGHPRAGRQPLRVVLADKSPLPPGARLFRNALRRRTIIYRSQPLTDVLERLGRRQVTTLLVEGGTALFGSLFAFGMVDEVIAYFAPLLCGGDCSPVVDLALPGGSLALEQVEFTPLGRDVRVRGLVRT